MIVEDDDISMRIIKHYIENTNDLSLKYVCKDAFEALQILKSEEDHGVELIFLDVELPQMSGLEFLELIGSLPILVVLTTSRSDYATEAFEHDVVDYLVKPIKYPRFVKAVDKVKEELAVLDTDQSGTQSIFVKVESKIIKLDYQDINFIEALADYVIIHTINKKYVVHATMKGIEKKLAPSKLFFRVHRSFIVNKSRITCIEDLFIKIGSHSIPIGRSYKNDFMKKLDVL